LPEKAIPKGLEKRRKKIIREGLGKREEWRKKRRKVRNRLRKRPKKWFNKRQISPKRGEGLKPLLKPTPERNQDMAQGAKGDKNRKKGLSY